MTSQKIETYIKTNLVPKDIVPYRPEELTIMYIIQGEQSVCLICWKYSQVCL
jgi:hypothetical protein